MGARELDPKSGASTARPRFTFEAGCEGRNHVETQSTDTEEASR